MTSQGVSFTGVQEGLILRDKSLLVQDISQSYMWEHGSEQVGLSIPELSPEPAVQDRASSEPTECLDFDTRQLSKPQLEI